MTEQPPDTAPPPGEPPRERHAPPDQPALPGWVPTLIGVILVLMAALAVYTGLRYRNPTLANGIIRRRTPPRAMTGGGPPGEPEPGASLMFPENSPTANEVSAAGAHMAARRGLLTNVSPDDAVIYVNGVAIGEARQFRTMDTVYDFPSPGNYTIRLVAPGYQEQQFVVTASDDAPQEIATVTAKLARAPQ